ncbi:MAG: PEBP family protein [Actinobacteria bacterium]|nr:PEBP family protein [Actinomycetota bacterium]
MLERPEMFSRSFKAKRSPVLRSAVALGLALMAAATLAVTSAEAEQPAAKTSTFTAEVWADNWFALYVNGKKVGEDSVPITTERSFNAEKINFTATYPLTIGLMAKDYTENASGLEYIGTDRQQIGDGGIIAQVRDNKTGKVITVTNAAWQALVLSKAPLNPSCVTSSNPTVDCKSSTITAPANWSKSGASTTGWTNASVYTPAEVGVKEGYALVTWDPAAKLIWGSNLELDNTVLLRTNIKAP